MRTPSERRRFLELPYRLHRHEPHWVPPLRGEQRWLVRREANPFFDHGEVRLLVACRGRRVVGRVAAVDDPRRRDAAGAREGSFGLFACAPDAEAARALFDAAGGWLRARGAESVTGPADFTTNDPCGLLVDGFDRPPAVGMPYHPPYYAELFAACGLAKAKDLLAWETATTLHEQERIRRVAEFAGRRGDVTVRPLDLRDFPAECDRIRSLYNSAWERNWGFVPLTDREFDAQARRLRPLLVPDLALIAEVRGEPAAFSLALPDVAPALAAARGRMHTCGVPTGLFRFLRARGRLDAIRVMAQGVRAEHRFLGLGLLLSVRTSQAAARLGYRTAEISWVLEDNEAATLTLRRLGARPGKRYRLYRYAL
ncbi:GNAT family N-acetyltransferase [Streptomyces roseolilacinus]|uniref:N-acetyltransferase n=1 Tax=Streptomyces roseolilacinus TaxID=66904 RepID=UPI00380244B7